MKTINTKRHKWADVIIAWVNGQEIQYQYQSKLWQTFEGDNPNFSESINILKWRIKPTYPTLGEIAKTAWVHMEFGKEFSGNVADKKWIAAANAVAAAIKSGEFSETEK